MSRSFVVVVLFVCFFPGLFCFDVPDIRNRLHVHVV